MCLYVTKKFKFTEWVLCLLYASLTVLICKNGSWKVLWLLFTCSLWVRCSCLSVWLCQRERGREGRGSFEITMWRWSGLSGRCLSASSISPTLLPNLDPILPSDCMLLCIVICAWQQMSKGAQATKMYYLIWRDAQCSFASQESRLCLLSVGRVSKLWCYVRRDSRKLNVRTELSSLLILCVCVFICVFFMSLFLSLMWAVGAAWDGAAHGSIWIPRKTKKNLHTN